MEFRRSSLLMLSAGALLVQGCAHRTYERPGMTQAELDKDWKACADLQLKIENSMGGRVHNNGDPEEYSTPCMEKRGYHQVLIWK